MDFDIKFFKNEDFTSIFKKYGFEITKIYKGKDNYCRCGCGGKYYYPNDKSFKRIVNNAKAALKYLAENGNDKSIKNFQYNNVAYQYDGWINIPIYDEDRPQMNQCYCVYFKKNYSPHYIVNALKDYPCPFHVDDISEETLIQIEKDLFFEINQIEFEFKNFDEEFETAWWRILEETALNHGLKYEEDIVKEDK